MKWRYLFNIDTISIIFLILAVLYCFFKFEKRKKKKFIGIGDSGWDISSGKGSQKFSKKRRRKPKINKHEEKCRSIFEKIFKKKFKSVRPDWLKNPVTKKNLELDGYCDDIKTKYGRGLAFEYDGIQHSKYTSHFHKKGPKEFIYQTKKDSWKDFRCKEMGVVLIRIPHFVIFDDLERYITTKLKKEGLLPQNSNKFLGGLYN